MNKLLDNVWYHIPEFNGYVINNEGLVRSMKFFNSNPEGIYIKYTTRKNGTGYYELSDYYNKRVKRSKEELLELVKTSPTLYMLNNDSVYIGSRNVGSIHVKKGVDFDFLFMQEFNKPYEEAKQLVEFD